jgi:predicted DNA-binding transcriptional regulator YafY
MMPERLLDAARGRRLVLRIQYRKWRGLPIERDIEVYAFDDRYVDAYCRLREDPRTFRRDRIVDATLTGTPCSRWPEIEAFFAAHGWVGRDEAWRWARLASIRTDALCDALLD